MEYTTNFEKMKKHFISTPHYKQILPMEDLVKFRFNPKPTETDYRVQNSINLGYLKGNLYVLAQDDRLDKYTRMICYQMGYLLDRLIFHKDIRFLIDKNAKMNSGFYDKRFKDYKKVYCPSGDEIFKLYHNDTINAYGQKANIPYVNPFEKHS